MGVPVKRLIIALVVLWASTAWATSYFFVRSPSGPQFFVDNSGSPACNDSNPGTSSAAPWCTVAKVSAQQATFVPDSHINFRRGGIWHEELTITNMQGTSGHPVVITAYGSPNPLPVIDGSSTRATCINALHTTAKYLTIDSIECRNTTQYGITFQTAGSGMPGITVSNSNIHNTGPGAYAGATQGVISPSDSHCTSSPPAGPAGCDDPGLPYRNQLDFEADGKGAGVDNVHFINNIVKNCGGHNCLQVHYDGGAPIVQGNTVGPGCVHNCIDVKGSGTFGTTQAVITQNVATTGVLTCPGNCSAGIYVANSFHGGVGSDNLVTLNTVYNSAAAFQHSPDDVCAPLSGTHCPQHIEAYNNTFVATVYAYLGSSCEAPGSGCGFNEDTTITFVNQILDGGIANVQALVNLTESHTDCGGHQHKSGSYVNYSCANMGDITNIDPLYTNFAGNIFTLTGPSPLHNAGLAGTGTGLTSIGAFP